MRHTSKHRNNRIRLQKIEKKLIREAKLAKKAARAKGKAAAAK